MHFTPYELPGNVYNMVLEQQQTIISQSQHSISYKMVFSYGTPDVPLLHVHHINIFSNVPLEKKKNLRLTATRVFCY